MVPSHQPGLCSRHASDCTQFLSWCYSTLMLKWTPCMQSFYLVCWTRSSQASWHRWFLILLTQSNQRGSHMETPSCLVTCHDFQIRDVCESLLACFLSPRAPYCFPQERSFHSALAPPFNIWDMLGTCASCPLSEMFLHKQFEQRTHKIK